MLRRSAAGSSGDRQGLPEAVVLEQKKNRWDGRLAAVLLGRGGVAAVREGAEKGTRCRLPSTGGAIAVRQEAEEHRAVHQRCPVPSHGTASEPLS